VDTVWEKTAGSGGDVTGREIHIKDVVEVEIDTILAEDIDFEGELTFRRPLMIKGRFRGKVDSPSDLYIGEGAEVEATIKASKVSSKGRVTGDIFARSRVELFSSARVHGDVETPDLVMESGCVFDGNCRMPGKGSAKATGKGTGNEGP
jgi:cytoskeletal protein CcmA (bactofilin family)